MDKKRPAWVKDKTFSKDFKQVESKPYDDYKDFVMEPSGCYALIKLLPESSEIALAVCNKDHEIEAEFRGKRAQDIYFNLFKYEEENNKNWFKGKDHIAYLGKELRKAETALNENKEFEQE